MIKISQAVAERLVLVCLYLRNREYGCYAMCEEALGIHPRDFKPKEVLRDIFEGNGLTRDECDWSFILGQLAEGLQEKGGNTDHQPALIEIIVQALQQPNSRSVLSGRTLLELRRAVLFPEEMSKVAESIRKELHCTNCGKLLHDGEMITFSSDRGGDGTNLFCTRCTIPTKAACRAGAGCENASPLDSKMVTKAMGTKPDCGAHTAINAATGMAELLEDNPFGQLGNPPIGQQMPPPLDAPQAARRFVVGGRGAGRNAAAPAPPEVRRVRD